MSPNDFGKKLLTEQCQQIRIYDLVRKARIKLKESFISNSIKLDDYSILLNKSKTGFGGVRYWFCCPSCNRRAGIVYKHPITGQLGCRICLGLDYRKHRYKGMIEEKLANN